MLLVVNNLCKWYGERLVVKNVSFELAAGEILALTGPNGAGKSSVLSVLATVTKADRGTLEFMGAPYQVSESSLVRQNLGAVFHAPALYSNMTARENLRFFARIYGIGEPDARIAECLNAVQLEPRADSRVKTLSNGMRKRLAIARALMSRPKLLLLDEPETGLDKESFGVLVGLLTEQQRAGNSVISATHSSALLAELGARVLQLRDGAVHSEEAA